MDFIQTKKFLSRYLSHLFESNNIDSFVDVGTCGICVNCENGLSVSLLSNEFRLSEDDVMVLHATMDQIDIDNKRRAMPHVNFGHVRLWKDTFIDSSICAFCDTEDCDGCGLGCERGRRTNTSEPNQQFCCLCDRTQNDHEDELLFNAFPNNKSKSGSCCPMENVPVGLCKGCFLDTNYHESSPASFAKCVQKCHGTVFSHKTRFHRKDKTRGFLLYMYRALELSDVNIPVQNFLDAVSRGPEHNLPMDMFVSLTYDVWNNLKKEPSFTTVKTLRGIIDDKINTYATR